MNRRTFGNLCRMGMAGWALNLLELLQSLTLPLLFFLTRTQDASSPRQAKLLNGSGWQFVGYDDATKPQDIGTDAFNQAAWTAVEVPHTFQTRAAYDTLTRGWYKRQVTVDHSARGKELYLVFEGAATIADVFVNGQHLGQHRGAYTRFIFDATAALPPGNHELAVLVDDAQADTKDCLPANMEGLFKAWGGLYRNVWLLTTAPVHIDPTDFAAPGIYLTPTDVSADSAKLSIHVLLRNASQSKASATVQSKVIDPTGKILAGPTATVPLDSAQKASADCTVPIDRPVLWGALQPHLYHVETSVSVNGQVVDEVTQATGFRWLDWDWKDGNVSLNGKRIIFYGADLHQEIEGKGSALSAEDHKFNFETMSDLGVNFMRLPHYPQNDTRGHASVNQSVKFLLSIIIFSIVQ